MGELWVFVSLQCDLYSMLVLVLFMPYNVVWDGTYIKHQLCCDGETIKYLMMPTLSSLVTPEVVDMTTSDDKVGIMTSVFSEYLNFLMTNVQILQFLWVCHSHFLAIVVWVEAWQYWDLAGHQMAIVAWIKSGLASANSFKSDVILNRYSAILAVKQSPECRLPYDILISLLSYHEATLVRLFWYVTRE